MKLEPHSRKSNGIGHGVIVAGTFGSKEGNGA